MGQLRVFLSYSSRDKRLAGRIKNAFDHLGIRSFLAHDDVKPTVEWEKRILRELAQMHLFVPILTRNFLRPPWTLQEVGFALAQGSPVISLKVSIDPPGFLAKYQAFRFDKSNVTRSCLKVAKLIHTNRILRSRFLSGLIDVFEVSDSFDEAKASSTSLAAFDGYTMKQVNRVLRAAISNDQIYRSWHAKKAMATFLSNHGKVANQSLVLSYRKLST